MLDAYETAAKDARVAINTTVYDYETARSVVEAADADLLVYWDRVNLNYATVLSNLLRYAVLFTRGGVYHDLKHWLPKPALEELVSRLDTHDIILEENPSRDPSTDNRKMRNTNMAAARPGLRYFETCLAEMKEKLRRIDADPPASTRKAVFDLDSHTGIHRIAATRRPDVSKHQLFLAYVCRSKEPRPNCTDAADISGTLDGESWVARKWRAAAVASISSSYNREGHWSSHTESILNPRPRPPPPGRAD